MLGSFFTYSNRVTISGRHFLCQPQLNKALDWIAIKFGFPWSDFFNDNNFVGHVTDKWNGNRFTIDTSI